MSEEFDLFTILESPWFHGAPPESVVRLAGDASTRSYYRALYGPGRSAIIMLLPEPRHQQEHSFLKIQAFLQMLELPVPHIYAHDSEHGLIVLEDLGDSLLEAVVEDASKERLFELYCEAVDLLIKLRLKTADKTTHCESFNPPFDEKKFMEEFGFFVTHFIEGFLNIVPPASVKASLDGLFTKISLRLSKEPRIFCHRDYHSRNLILHNGRLVIIDFQDARMGPAQYDLASLLRDSYVTLPGDLVDALLDRYQDGIPHKGRRARLQFRYVFDVMSLQRNIKALGTFGYQVSMRKYSRYLASIPRTVAYINHAIRLHEDFAPHIPVVEDYICGPALEMSSQRRS